MSRKTFHKQLNGLVNQDLLFCYTSNLSFDTSSNGIDDILPENNNMSNDEHHTPQIHIGPPRDGDCQVFHNVDIV